ncbi:MAG TPA: cytochrome c [Anaeromyxobacteraceae bacterium]|nr:cytochrome c [Anaeromyxobacteraceae bacterium]
MTRTLLALALAALAAPSFAADGAAIYAKSCASCHGEDGKGGTAPPVAGKSAAFVAEVLGMHAPAMKVGKLSAADAGAVAKYVAAMK